MDKLLDIKRRYDIYGEEYVDMCIPAVDVAKLKGHIASTVSQDENGRLDNFVWKNAAKNMDMIDSVMYANHIFNPFSIKEGDLLYVPIDDDSVYYTSDEPNLPDGTKNSNSSKGKKEMTYAEKVAYIARKGLGSK